MCHVALKTAAVLCSRTTFLEEESTEAYISMVWAGVLCVLGMGGAETLHRAEDDPLSLLRSCATTLRNPLLEQSTIQIAELFGPYASSDALPLNQELIARSIAGFHWRQEPTPTDVAAAAVRFRFSSELDENLH
jgi:hypothetical protein